MQLIAFKGRKQLIEKENDIQTGNKKKELYSSLTVKPISLEKAYQSTTNRKPIKAPKKHEPKTNTEEFCVQYGKETPRTMELEYTPFMKKHQIDGTLRARMLDWMV